MVSDIHPGFVPRAMGASRVIPKEHGFWKTVQGMELIEFIRGLARPAADINPAIWDLSKVNRMPVASLSRFKSLQRVVASVDVQVDEWDNVEGSHI